MFLSTATVSEPVCWSLKETSLASGLRVTAAPSVVSSQRVAVETKHRTQARLATGQSGSRLLCFALGFPVFLLVPLQTRLRFIIVVAAAVSQQKRRRCQIHLIRRNIRKVAWWCISPKAGSFFHLQVSKRRGRLSS